MLDSVIRAMQENKLYARVAYIAGQEAKPRVRPTPEELEDIEFAYHHEHGDSNGKCDTAIFQAIFILGATCNLHMTDYVLLSVPANQEHPVAPQTRK